MFQKTETKDIKRELQKHFNWKFSVTRGRGTAYHWIGISWINGPPEKDVRSFCNKFNDTSGDDIMTDLWVGSQYTNEYREFTPEYCWQLCGKLDLRKPPSLKDQMENYFDYLRHKGYDQFSFGVDENQIDIRSETGTSFYEENKIVKERLELQGYEVMVNDDNTQIIVKTKKVKPDTDNTPQSDKKQPQNVNKPIISEYKGHPTITLPWNDKGFTFGLTKAHAILEYYEHIKAFVELNS